MSPIISGGSGGGGSQPAILHSVLTIPHTDALTAFVQDDRPVFFNWDGSGGSAYEITTQGAATAVVSIPDRTTAYARVRMQLNEQGSGLPGYVPGYMLPVIPSGLAAVFAGNGANPANVWDVTYSNLEITAVTGTDAGKSALMGLDLSSAHPLSARYADPNIEMALNQKLSGALAVTTSVVSGQTRIAVPSNGVYGFRWVPFVDVYYP